MPIAILKTGMEHNNIYCKKYYVQEMKWCSAWSLQNDSEEKCQLMGYITTFILECVLWQFYHFFFLQVVFIYPDEY